MLVQGTYSKLLGKGLAKQFKVAYGDISNARFKPYLHKSYKLGFLVSHKMVEDDFYGGIVKVLKGKRKKLKVQTIHRVYITDMGSGVELDGNIIRILGSTTYDITQGKDIVKALNMLLKLSKKPVKKVRRKRNVKA